MNLFLKKSSNRSLMNKLIISFIITAVLLTVILIYNMPVDMEMKYDVYVYTDIHEEDHFFTEVKITGKLFKSFFGLRNTFEGIIDMFDESRMIYGNNISNKNGYYIFTADLHSNDTWYIHISKDFNTLFGNIGKSKIAYPAENMEDVNKIIGGYIAGY